MAKTRHEEIAQACHKYHEEHPQVWVFFVRLTLSRINLGYKNYSVNAVFEVIRWQTDEARVNPDESFKINNNFRAHYARWFMNAYPEYIGFFRLRRQNSLEAPPVNQPELGPKDFPYEDQ